MDLAETPSLAVTRSAFVAQLESVDRDALHAESLASLMLNVTMRCNLACSHCHHACSPARDEQMSLETMHAALDLADAIRPGLLDITGGEPALWPNLRALLVRASRAGHRVRVRTNLVALLGSEAADLPALFAEHGVAVLASLPGTTAEEIAEQRGGAAFEPAIEALRALSAVGYGSGTGLTLDLAYNPPLGRTPALQRDLTTRFRDELAPLGVRFDSVRAIANVPVGRYRETSHAEHGLADYLGALATAFNPEVAATIECRHGLTVGWDGTLSDCDFNLACGIGLAAGPRTLADLLSNVTDGHAGAQPALTALAQRRIAFGRHCFACTAGAGSS